MASEAPERIWASSVTENYGEWQTVTDGLPRPTEYVRADLCSALEAQLAEAKAENERLMRAANRALSLLDQAIGDTDPWDTDNPLLLASQALARGTGQRGEPT